MRKRMIASVLVLTLAVSTAFVNAANVDAAKKPSLIKKISMKVGKSKILKLKNGNKKAKVTWKSSKKSIVKILKQVKKGNKAAVKIKGQKKGTASITASYKLGRKIIKFTCKVNVKTDNPVATTEEPTITVEPTIIVEPTITPTVTMSAATEAPSPTVEPTITPTVTMPAATEAPSPTVEPTITPTVTMPVTTIAPPDDDDKDDDTVEYLWKLGDTTINNTFEDYFISGISTSIGDLRFGEKAAFVKHHFGSVTMGNENKMESIVTDDETEDYPYGIARANVDAYYATGGEAKVILDYEMLEKILSYCKDNGLKLRYNSFVWHSQVREYFFLQDYNWAEYTEEKYIANGWDVNNYHKLADKETMKKRLAGYIDQVIEYIYSHGYGDVIYAYDVISEATNGDSNNKHRYYVNVNAVTTDALLVEESISGAPNFQTNGGVRTNGNNNGTLVTSDSSPEEVEQMMSYEGRMPVNDSYWYATMGPDYLYLSFLYAHDAVEKYYEQYKDEFGYTTKPSLIYNDYNQRVNDHISLAKYINLACNLERKTSGVTYCDGIGLQSHSIGEGTQEQMIKAVVDAGLECQITELDELLTGEAQASKMKKLYEIYKKYSKKGEYGKVQGEDYIGVTSVTQWGICDGDGSWGGSYIMEPYRGDNPNLKLSPKPAFFAILQAGGVECGDKDY